MSKQLILASASPRRRSLLQQIGVKFEVFPVDLPEVRQPNELPEDYVRRLSQEKATAAFQRYPEDGDVSQAMGNQKVFLGSDTIVARDSTVLEKPRSKTDFVRMMSELSQSKHQVITGVCVTNGAQSATNIVTTEVSFRSISDQEMDAYWNTGEPQDKAGGYGIQGVGAIFVEGISGSYSNVVGLPLFESQVRI